MIDRDELRAVHGRGTGGGAAGAGSERAADRSRSRRRRGDGRPRTRPGRARPTTRRPTPSSSPCVRPPRSSGANGSPTRPSSRPSSRARCASAPCSRATSRRSSTPCRTTRRGRRDRRSSSHSIPSLPRRIKVVSGIRRDEAEALFARQPDRLDRSPSKAGFGGPDVVWYPLPRRGVRVVDGAALEKRCAKAPWVRIPPSPPALITTDRSAEATGPDVVRGEVA